MFHYALKDEYPNLAIRLTSETQISDLSKTPKKVKAKALWDTGAMIIVHFYHASIRRQNRPFR